MDNTFCGDICYLKYLLLANSILQSNLAPPYTPRQRSTFNGVQIIYLGV